MGDRGDRGDKEGYSSLPTTSDHTLFQELQTIPSTSILVNFMYNIRKAIIILGIASASIGLSAVAQALPSQALIAQTNSESQQGTQELYQKGIDQINAEDYQGAIATFNQILQQNTDDVGALYNRGLAYTLMEDYEKAIADYTKVLELDPEDADAYENRALARTQIEDYPGAIADYTQVLRRNPEKAEAFYNRGLSRAQLEDYDAAIVDLQKAAKLYETQGNTEQAQAARTVAESLEQ